MTHVMIIEDETKIAEVVRDYCAREGWTSTLLASGAEAVEAVRNNAPDCVLLDVMLPGKDGLTICREVRQFSAVPIIMLTARVEEIDRLLGLEIGADDYVCKPFSPREVVARIKTVLRRVQPAAVTADELLVGDVTLFLERFECRVGQLPVELTPVEFRLLGRLMSQPGRVFSRDELMSAAYDDYRVVSDRTIDSHVKNLRRKLVLAGSAEEFIRSVYGVGYKLETTQ